MRIRNKYLTAALLMALLPMLAALALQRASTYYTGRQIAQRVRHALTNDAFDLLRILVKDYTRLLESDKARVRLLLQEQARAVERRLAAPPRPTPRIYMSPDYDRPASAPPDLHPSPVHRRADARARRLRPVPISLTDQVYFLPNRLRRDALAEDIARLSTMPEVYRRLAREGQFILAANLAFEFLSLLAVGKRE